MKFGLPVGVRDSILKQEESTQIALPRSNVGQKYFYEQQAQLAESFAGSVTEIFYILEFILYSYARTYIHTYMHAYMHAYIHMRSCIYMHTYIHL